MLAYVRSFIEISFIPKINGRFSTNVNVWTMLAPYENARLMNPFLDVENNISLVGLLYKACLARRTLGQIHAATNNNK